MEYADYIKTGTMPPALPPDEGEEERKRKLIASAGGVAIMPPVRMTPTQPSSAPSVANIMPPVPVAAAPRSDTSRTPALSGDAARVALAAASRQSRSAIEGTDRVNAMPPANATAQPTMPPVRTLEQPGMEVHFELIVPDAVLKATITRTTSCTLSTKSGDTRRAVFRV